MENRKLRMKKNIILAVVLLTIIITARLVPHPPNFTPLVSVALFGGVHAGKKISVVLPLIALFASDLFLGFHNTMLYVYGSMILISLIGLWLRSHRSRIFLIPATFFSAIIFYVVTNFGVWAQGQLYAQDLNGLAQSYYVAIPFFKNSLLASALYTVVLFGGYELAAAKIKQKKKIKHFFMHNSSRFK